MSEAQRERPVNIKGDKDGLTLVLSKDASFAEIRSDLERQLQQSNFFRGAATRIRIMTQDCALESYELDVLKQIILESGLTILDPASESALSLRKTLIQQEFETTGDLEVVEPKSSEEVTAASRAKRRDDDGYTEIIKPDAQTVPGPLRSGMRVTSRHSVVIMGDVNPGAEVISESNIIVWGVLRGRAHAGAGGNKDAKIYALQIQAIQLAIADCITAGTAENKSVASSRGFEVARLIQCEDGSQNILVDEVAK